MCQLFALQGIGCVLLLECADSRSSREERVENAFSSVSVWDKRGAGRGEKTLALISDMPYIFFNP